MIGFILRRFVLMFFTLVVMSMLSFAVIQLPPGDLITKYIQDLETGDGSFGLQAGGAWEEVPLLQVLLLLLYVTPQEFSC